MLANSSGFRVVPVTIHIPINEVSKQLSYKLLKETILILNNSLKLDFKVKSPKIIVTGLNPHAGENSAMGSEEINIIIPVIRELTKKGLHLFGPLAADSAFTSKKRDGYDAFLCMYHDQALIPIKTISFDDCVNITLGLSFVRTSPDHGTALDIAGQDIANPKSLILAIKEAKNIVESRGTNAKKN